MSEKITVPTLGESVTEATVSKWLKSQGEKVSVDEPLVELETDKVNVEVPSPISGVLGNITVKEGETVNVGSLLGTVDSSDLSKGSSVNEVNNYSPPKKEKDKVQPKVFEEEKIIKSTKIKMKKIEEPTLKLEEEEPLILEQVHEEKEAQNIQKQVSPAARKLDNETKVDLSNVEGSGKNGVILKEDIMSLMGSKPAPSERKINHGPQENAAMLTTFNEVDMSEVMAMRSQYKDEFQNKYQVKLGFMSFFVKACVIGLKNYPAINAEIQGEEIVYKNYYNISIAVGTDRGLVVPVLRETDEMSFADIEKKIGELGQKARDGKITIDDLQGGTFTITNGGIYGSMLSTPILNPPQSAVLGMHNIIQRPVVVDGNVEVRPIMYLALSYDHRIIDGKEAVSFLKIIIESLEQPNRLYSNI